MNDAQLGLPSESRVRLAGQEYLLHRDRFSSWWLTETLKEAHDLDNVSTRLLAEWSGLSQVACSKRLTTAN